MKDVVIIGAGPVGLFSVFKCGMLGLKSFVFDALPFVGGQCVALYPTKPIYDIPAYPTIQAKELADNLFKQASIFNPTYKLGEKVIKITKTDNSFIVHGDKGTEVFSKTVLIAAGTGAFGPNRPPFENISDFEGTSIFYMVSDLEFFSNKNIVIAGGGDSAVDWAIELSKIASSITLVHRRDKFKAAPYSLLKLKDLIDQKKINLMFPFQLHKISGINGLIENLEVISMDGKIERLHPDVLLPFFGLSTDIGPIKDLGLELEKSHIVVDQSTCSTNIPGVFAIGDIATYPKKKKLILCGFSEAALACYAIQEYIHPNQVFHFEHSTSMMMPS
jgi:thioredoxin reductase (NADPH)